MSDPLPKQTASETIALVVANLGSSVNTTATARWDLQTLFQRTKPNTALAAQLAYAYERLVVAATALDDASKSLTLITPDEGDLHQ